MINHCSSKFTGEQTSGCYRMVTDASDLTAGSSEYWATWVGSIRAFTITSKRTGKVITFACVATHYNKDQDVECWSFLATKKSVAEHPECQNVRVTVYND